MSCWTMPAETHGPVASYQDQAGAPAAFAVINGEWFVFIPIVSAYLLVLRANGS